MFALAIQWALIRNFEVTVLYVSFLQEQLNSIVFVTMNDTVQWSKAQNRLKI